MPNIRRSSPPYRLPFRFRGPRREPAAARLKVQTAAHIMMTLDETISCYQRPPLSGVAGEHMVQFLVPCRDLLGNGDLFFNPGHSTLWVTKHPQHAQAVAHPIIRIYCDGAMFEYEKTEVRCQKPDKLLHRPACAPTRHTPKKAPRRPGDTQRK